MENASKALIIAGAILIAITLISIGIMVITSANGVVDSSQKLMDQQAIQAFNSKFMNFAGKQRGSTVRSLMQTVIANNGTNDDDTSNVAVSFEGQVKDPQTVLASVNSSKYYNITIDVYDNKATNPGLVKQINIEEVKSAP